MASMKGQGILEKKKKTVIIVNSKLLDKSTIPLNLRVGIAGRSPNERGTQGSSSGTVH